MAQKHRHEQHEEHVDESWLIPYADLLTLLLALFIVLFASSQTDSVKFQQMMGAMQRALNGGVGIVEFLNPSSTTQDITLDVPPPPSVTTELQDPHESMVKERNLEELKIEIDKYIETNELNSQVQTALKNDGLMIVIRDHALFDSGSAAVKQESRKLGIALSDMLVKYKQFEVMVAGHTDNQPIRNAMFASNWNLSTERALNFMQVILQNPQLNPGKFRAVGFGEYRPIDTNATPQGRAKNRRVEISIF